MLHLLRFLIVASCITLCTVPALAQTRYTVHDLGSIGGSTAPGAVSPTGVAVGYSYTAPGSNFFHLFRNSGGGIEDLGTAGGYGADAWGINSAGQIVGGSVPLGGGHFRAYLYQNGVWTDIGVGSGYRSTAYGINEAGHVVGSYLNFNGTTTGFIYKNSTMTDLPTLGGSSGQARAINDSGVITGWATTEGGVTHAYINNNGVMTDLGTLGGSSSFGFDINNSGEVAGYSLNASGSSRAFVYSGGVMHNLGTFGGARSESNAINNLGQTVGWTTTSNSTVAFIAYGTTVYDLNTLIPANSGWSLVEAVDINDRGEIVGIGNFQNATRAFILRPEETLTVSPSSVSIGSGYSVSWTAPNGSSATDWIGMYKVGDPDSAILWYTYTGGATSGTINLPANTAGTFNFRYFKNNGFERRAVSNTLTVSVPEGITLVAAPTAVNPGANVTVNFTAPAGRPIYDWIGLFQVGADNRSFLWFRYVNGATSGSFTLPAPPAGDYEFRYLANDGYIDLARSNTFRVNAVNYTVQTSATTVPPGGTLDVSWSAPPGSSQWDWIGLFREGDDNRTYLWDHWFYTSGAETGTRAMKMPTTPGRYVFRYLLNDHYTHTAESAVIVVE